MQPFHVLAAGALLAVGIMVSWVFNVLAIAGDFVVVWRVWVVVLLGIVDLLMSILSCWVLFRVLVWKASEEQLRLLCALLLATTVWIVDFREYVRCHDGSRGRPRVFWGGQRVRLRARDARRERACACAHAPDPLVLRKRASSPIGPPSTRGSSSPGHGLRASKTSTPSRCRGWEWPCYGHDEATARSKVAERLALLRPFEQADQEDPRGLL